MGLLDGIFGGDPKVKTTTVQQDKVTDLTYLDTLKYLQGNMATSGLETGPNTFTKDRSKDFDPLLSIVSGGFLGGSKKKSTTVEEGGWKVKSTSMVPKWDKARYGIGIKEIGAWSYKYAERSGFVSVPYRTPRPIRSVSLVADELIPKVFNDMQVTPWILYWITFNDGEVWTPIAPLKEGPTQMLDGKRLPQVIHVNSGIPGPERDDRAGYVDLSGEANQVRLKVVLQRPDNMDDMTPVLKGYRLKMTLRGGL
jgi:hypothetical protein